MLSNSIQGGTQAARDDLILILGDLFQQLSPGWLCGYLNKKNYKWNPRIAINQKEKS